jgi:hypothetical protein
VADGHLAGHRVAAPGQGRDDQEQVGAQDQDGSFGFAGQGLPRAVLGPEPAGSQPIARQNGRVVECRRP